MISPKTSIAATHVPWNKGRRVGPKPPLKPDEVQAIKLRLKSDGRTRDLALFCLAIDSKLRASDVLRLTVQDVAEHAVGGELKMQPRSKTIQKKTRAEVGFEITPDTQACLRNRIKQSEKLDVDVLFSSVRSGRRSLSTRQYERLVKDWVQLI